MSQHLFNDTDITAIADAIRQKDGSQTTMTVSDMPTRISNIPSGGTDYMAERLNQTLSSYTIPDTISLISGYSFYWCPLTSISIPSRVIEIQDYAFYGTQLTSLFIPSNVRSIGSYCFSHMIEIPNQTYTLGSVTFDDNMSLYCASRAFSDNRNLTTLNNFSIDNFNLQGERVLSVGLFDSTALVGDISLGDSATVNSRAFNNSYASGFLYIHLTQRDISQLASSYTFGTGSSSATRSFNFDHCRLMIPYSADHSILAAYQTQWPDYSSIMIEENN